MSTVANKASFVDIEFISASMKIFLPESGVNASCQLPWNDPTYDRDVATWPQLEGL